MATKIKLQVNHGKHKKKENQSGARLCVKQGSTISESVNPDDSKGKVQKKHQQENDSHMNMLQIKAQQKQDNEQQPQKQIIKQQQNPDIELATIERIKNQQLKTKKTIQQLISQYKEGVDDIFMNHGHNPQKQKDIRERLGRLQQQQERRKNKIKRLEAKRINQSIDNQNSIKNKLNQLSQNAREQRKKRAEAKIQKLKALSTQRLNQQSQFIQYYQKQYKAKKPRYIKYEQQFKEKQRLENQEKKEKLRQLKRKYAPIDIEQINDFQDEYEETKWNIMEENERKRQEINELIEKQNMELKDKIWKGECHRRVHQERKEQEKSMNSARTRLEKTREYGTIIHNQYMPMISERKREASLNLSKVLREDEEIEQEGNYRFKKVARQKYVHGQNKGLVIEKLRRSLQHQQKVKKGNSYLEYVVNLPKNRTDGTQSARLQKKQPYQPLQRKKTPSTTFAPPRPNNPYYKNKYTNNKLSSNLKSPQMVSCMINQLRDQKNTMQLQEKVIKYGKYNGILQLQNKHNHLNQKMVDSISEKLKILSMMND